MLASEGSVVHHVAIRTWVGQDASFRNPLTLTELCAQAQHGERYPVLLLVGPGGEDALSSRTGERFVVIGSPRGNL